MDAIAEADRLADGLNAAAATRHIDASGIRLQQVRVRGRASAINPAISTLGWTLPTLVSGELLTSMVLGIPTLAPIFLTSLRTQDMFLAGSIVFVLSILTVLGTLLSDVLLAFLDPRMRGAV